MAIIYTYPKLINLQNQDLLLISDTSSKRKDTMRVELGDLANFIITSTSAITGGGTENYVPIFGVTGNEIGDSQLQQSPQLGSGLYQMKFRNADRFIIDKPSSVTSGDPEYLIQQDGQYKVSFGWDDDGGGFGFIYNWAGNGLRLGAAGQNPQFELDTTTPKIISHTDHEFEGAILDVNGLPGTAGQRLSSTVAGVEWVSDGGGTVTNIATTDPITGGPITNTGTIGITQATSTTDGYLSSTDWNTFNDKASGTGTTNTLAVWTGSQAIGDSIVSQTPGIAPFASINGALTVDSGLTVTSLSNAVDFGGSTYLFESNGVEFGAELDMAGNKIYDLPDPTQPQDAATKAYVDTAVTQTTVIINGLVNNLASAGSGGYDFMEFVSNVTGPTQIPVIKLPRDMRLVGFTFVWMGDTALTIGAGEQVEFTIGTIPSGSNPIIGNYTSSDILFTLDSAVSGTWANGDDSGLTIDFNAGDIIAVVGQETGTVTPNTGELGITLEFITQ
jgi:hypothetical protein